MFVPEPRPLIRWGWLWLTLVVLIAYWPLTIFQYSLADGDTMDCWLPWRHFIAASLNDGHLPSWNPLQQMGYPIHADLQGPSWYPEALILGGTVGMGPHVLQLLFLLYVIVGGSGMRLFTRQLVNDDRVAVITGIAYALSGFFTAHAMHFYSVISAAWMPWMFWSLLRFLALPSWRNALIGSLFLFLLLTGGNHTFLIIAAYPATVLVIVASWKGSQRRDRAYLKRSLSRGSLAMIVGGLMACGTLYSLWEVAPYISRVKGLDLALAQQDPFTPTAIASLIWPAAARADAAILGTDPTMANGFFGAIILLFAVIGITQVRGHVQWVLLGSAVVSALASFGPLMPVREFLWQYAPGMDLFRFPSYFWYFVMLFTLPIAGHGIALALEERYRKVLMVLAFAIIVLSLAMVMRDPWAGGWIENAPLLEQMRLLPTGSLLFMNGIVLICPMLLLILWSISRSRRWQWLAIIIAIEMMIGIQFNQWNTTLGHSSPAELAYRINALPEGPILPRLHPMGLNTDDSQVMHLLWRNTQNFQGNPTHAGFNSFWMAGHERLSDHHPKLKASMLEQPLIYFADTIMALTNIEPDLIPKAPAYLNDPPLLLEGDPSGEATIGMLHFDYENMKIKTSSGSDRLLVVQQDHYPGWRIAVDGARIPIRTINVAAFGAVIPAGEHEVRIWYHKPVLWVLLLISFSVCFAILFTLAWTSAHKAAGTTMVFILLLAWCFSIFGHRSKADELKKGWNEVIELQASEPSRSILVNTDRGLPVNVSGTHELRMDTPDEMGPVEAALSGMFELPRSLLLAWHGLPINAATKAYLADQGYRLEKECGNTASGAFRLVHEPELPDPLQLVHHDPLGGGKIITIDRTQVMDPFFMNIGELLKRMEGQMIIDIEYKGAGAAGAFMVIERHRNGRITDHETIPLATQITDTGRWHKFHCVRPLPHSRYSGEELAIHVRSVVPDSLLVRDLRIRIGELPF